jgi:hypothetical protein
VARRAKIQHLSPHERWAIGRAARKRVPLESHAAFETTGRIDPIELLESQAVTQVPELVPTRPRADASPRRPGSSPLP